VAGVTFFFFSYCDTLQGPIGLRPGYSQKNGPSASGLRGPLSEMPKPLGFLPCTKYYEFQKVLKEQKQGSHKKNNSYPAEKKIFSKEKN
jgi:hypothetical protein